MPTISGEMWTLSKQRGHIVLVNFWAPWCPPCREETPDLIRLNKEYGPRGLVIAGLAADPSDQEAIRKFVKQYKINYPVLFPRSDSAMVQAVDLLPTTLLLNSQGKRVKTYVGRLPIPTVRSDLASLLAAR
jgi:thiol-disulfide isomerase/thioredoxin